VKVHFILTDGSHETPFLVGEKAGKKVESRQRGETLFYQRAGVGKSTLSLSKGKKIPSRGGGGIAKIISKGKRGVRPRSLEMIGEPARSSFIRSSGRQSAD